MVARKRRDLIVRGAGATLLAALSTFGRSAGAAPAASDAAFEVTHPEEEWRRLLSPAAFDVLRGHGTEPPGSSPLDAEERAGTYRCGGCDLPVYDSSTKFHSGTGWPSFWAPIEGAVGTSADRSWFMTRTEVHCRRCGGHLGHVFDDGPRPTGQRYCMNGVAMRFEPKVPGTSS
jgi:peptide-methionine (R)-S-oxide reductase